MRQDSPGIAKKLRKQSEHGQRANLGGWRF
jgi:hypothetical protein